MTRLDSIAWFAGGYTTGGPDWLPWVFYGLLSLPAMLVLWLGWRVFRSGPRPVRDAALTWLMLIASALCAGVAYPRDPEMPVPAAIAAVLAVGCSLRARSGGSVALNVVTISGWVLWLPACGVLAIALR